MLFVSSAELPDPPGTKRRARSERKRLSRDAIVETAFVVLDKRGYDGFNMRGVADALGTGPASLYAHVTGKEELLDLMIDRLAAAIEVPEPDPDRWQEQVKAVITDIYRAFLEHPGLARANLGKIPSGPGALRTIDRFMGLLRAGQLPKKVVAYAVDILPLFATAYAFEQGIFAERMTGEEAARYLEELDEYWRALPADRFPNIHAIVDALIDPEEDPEARFSFGLDMLITGIAAQRDPRRS
jgi:AcrR family transcriptional regulator